MTHSPPHPAPPPLGRPPVKQRVIANDFHRRIVEGDLPPGTRLPSRRELASQFGGSLLSVQMALNQLEREGFIQSRGANGTFVSDHPPHLFDFALVFPRSPDQHPFPRFWTALANEASKLSRSTDPIRRITCWYGINAHPNNKDFVQLCQTVERRRLAGIIFAAPPTFVSNSSILDLAGIPRAMIASPSPRYPGISIVAPDALSFLSRAVEHLAAKGCRRIAMISMSNPSWDQEREFARLLGIHKMTSDPCWYLALDPILGNGMRRISRLLMRPGQSDRPDGLIIADDNFVEPVTAGLLDAGVRVPQELEIVAHCNFPWPTPSVVPARRLGYDAADVMMACLDAIDRQRAGSPPAAPIIIGARFEDELSSNDSNALGQR